MSSSFPRVKKSTRGYSIEEVDAFIAQARIAYDSNVAGAESLTSQAIRGTAFNVSKGGYSTRHVDAALERLENAFAERERIIAVAQQGEQAVLQQAETLGQTLTERFKRPAKKRFRRVGLFSQGYAVKDVDAFASRVSNYLAGNGDLTVSDVRSVTFRSAKRGYDETQVDAVLDALIELFLILGID